MWIYATTLIQDVSKDTAALAKIPTCNLKMTRWHHHLPGLVNIQKTMDKIRFFMGKSEHGAQEGRPHVGARLNFGCVVLRLIPILLSPPVDPCNHFLMSKLESLREATSFFTRAGLF